MVNDRSGRDGPSEGKGEAAADEALSQRDVAAGDGKLSDLFAKRARQREDDDSLYTIVVGPVSVRSAEGGGRTIRLNAMSRLAGPALLSARVASVHESATGGGRRRTGALWRSR